MSLFSVSVLAPSILVSAGDRTELRLRNGTSGTQVDFVTAPTLQLSLATYRTSWRLGYSPMLTRLDLGNPDAATLLIHSGSLTTDIELTPRTRLSFSEFASYGTQNFRALAVDGSATNPANSTAGPSTVPGQGGLAPNGTPLTAAVVQDQKIQFASLYASASLSHAFRPRWLGRATASGMSSGGLDAASELAIPRMKQATGSTSLSHAVSERDGLTMQLEGQTGKTEPGAEASLITAELSWTRRFSRTTLGSLTAGDAYVFVTLPTGEVLKRDLPVAAAFVELSGASSGWRHSLSLREDYAPFVDRILGTISQRTMTTLSASTTKHRLTLSTSFYGTASTYSVGQVSLLSAIGSTQAAIYRLDRHWSLELGARQASQRYANFSQQPLLWAVYSAITYTTGEWPL